MYGCKPLLYGGDLTDADVIAGLRNVPCSVTAEIYNLKFKIATELATMDAGIVPGTAYITQSACSVASMLNTPGEISEVRRCLLKPVMKAPVSALEPHM